MKHLLITVSFLAFSFAALSQAKSKTFSLAGVEGLKPVHVVIEPAKYEGKKSLRVLDTAQGITSGEKFVKLTEVVFHNGTIEAELAGRPAAKAGGTARGFVGIAFRVDETDTRYECIYLRPANGRAEDQVRRNHSVQYISHPHFPWEKLRRETPEKYESYVDLEVGKWTKVKIVVQDSTARLYVHGAAQPTLVVQDLKLGADRKGAVGLWIGPETEAYFRNLVITPND